MIPVPHGNMSRILSFKGYNAWFTFDSGISIPFPWLMWMMIPKMMGISARFPSLDGNRCTIPFLEWEQFKLLEKVSHSRPLTGIDNQFPSVTGIKRSFYAQDQWEQVHDSHPLTGISKQFPTLVGMLGNRDEEYFPINTFYTVTSTKYFFFGWGHKLLPSFETRHIHGNLRQLLRQLCCVFF